MRKTLNSSVFTIVLTIAALAGQSAWAQTFTIEASHDNSTNKTTFTITRSGSSLPQQTINYRTVNLSAYAGQHYTAVKDTYTFPANETTKTVEVSESTPGTDAYKYQTSTIRKYRFEVLDVNGFELAHNDRSFTIGTSISSSGLFSEKEITIFTSGTEFTDAGYDQSTNPHYINSSSYYSLSGIAPAAYYTLIGAQLRSTLSLEAREENNGYQYVQILINNTSSCDNRSGCSNGDPGNISLSRYMAGFDHEPSKANTNYATYTFPVTSQPNNCSEVSNAWDNGVTNKLYTQKFNTNCRATDGRLIIPADFNTFVVRFNASGGGTDHDKWLAKNVKAHIQAVDAAYPTLLSANAITVSAGPYVKGNTFYVSVPFKEIVKVTGTPTLTNNWGTLSYTSGSGSNVLTFMGTITTNIGSELTVSGLGGTVTDLAGNSFTWPSNITKTFNGVTSSATYTLAATNTSFTGLDGDYWVSDGSVLPQPHPTVYFYKGIVNSTNQVTLAEATDYTLAWADNTAAGTGTVTASGTESYNGSNSTTFPIRWSTYSVSFHSNGSIGIPASGTMSDQAFTYNTAQNLTANTFTRTGFTFAGWNTQPDGSGTAYTDGQSVSNLTPEDGGTVNLYAQWTVIPWAGSGTQEAPWRIQYPSQLNLLATRVNSGVSDYSGMYFLQTADLIYSADENNYTPIGDFSHTFCGNYNGGGYTISGINVTRTGTSDADRHVSLFGNLGTGAEVHTLTLASTTFTGYLFTGGIAGMNKGTVQDCRVESTVAIYAAQYNGSTHGGVVGSNDGIVEGCLCAATISNNGEKNCANYGGIVGYNNNGKTVRNCLYTGTTIVSSSSNTGAISGTTYGTITNNYFTNVDFGETTGARPARTITFTGGAAINSSETTYAHSGLTAYGTGNVALSYNDGTNTVTYSGKDQIVPLRYTGDATGYTISYTTTAGTISNSRLTMPAEDVTVSATLTPITYNIYYKLGGGALPDGQSNPANYNVESNDVTLVNPTRTGYTFAGWTCADLTEPTISVTITTGSIGNRTYTAHWAPITYSVHFDANGGTLSMDDQSFTYDAAQNLTANDFARTGYTFAGWTTNANGSGTTYTDGQNVTNLTAVDGAVIVLYAQWTAHTYTVHFDANGGTGTMNDQTFTYDVTENLTANAFTAPYGYKFYRWTTNADGTGNSYTNAQEVCNLTADDGITITLYAQWEVIPWSGSGTENDPYIISYPVQLDLLATNVNSGNTYDQKFFKLGADIAYDPTALDANGENYTAIGTNNHCFSGTFDGDGHTVSGIRIYKPNDFDQALFGRVNNGTVKNVILNDANITGNNDVSGIAGWLINTVTLENCLVINTYITATSNYCGAIAGDYDSTDATLNSNYYHNCSVTINGTTKTTDIGANNSDRDGARSVHSLTLGTGVTASGESVTIGTNTYYAAGTTVTLAYSGTVPEGCVLVLSVKDASNNDITVTENGDTYTFTMPASDASVSASLSVIDYETVNAGTEADPYIIYNKDQLDMLANRVNSGINEYGGKFFKLGADIAYPHTTEWDNANSTENNYTAIGNSDKAFCGTFDGDGHTVSGIRIYMPNEEYQGLFGRVWAGTVKNVFVTDARINGKWYVGGISGQLNGDPTIQDCLVLNTAITANSTGGAVIGKKYNGTCSHNFYRNCIVKVGSATYTTNIGLGSPRGDYAGEVGSVHAITLPANVTATGESVVIDGITYYANMNTISLSYTSELSKNEAPQFTVTKTDDNSVVAQTMGDFTMPAADVNISFELTKGYTLTLSDGITASGITTPGSDESNKYYVTGTIVTLSYSSSASTGYAHVYSVNGTAIESNTFTMPASDATVSVTVTDVWGMAGGADGSEAHPYIITTPVGLNLLASNVNSGTDYNGQFFKLGNDIAYTHSTDWDDATSTENNYTAIGNYSHDFRGTFDGDGHTISGIRIYMPDDNYQGLFGYVDAGTVKNVTLSDARITGKNRVAGIAGCTEYVLTKIDNCLILNAAITAQASGGVLVGYKGNGTYSHNFYHNCIVKVGSYTYTTNIGLGTPRGDYAGEVGSVHAITLPANVTASGESVVIDGITYYANKNTITLNASTGYAIISASYNDGSDHAITGNTFTMPASDVTVSASLTMPAIVYIDAQGVEQTCTDYTVLTSSNSGQELGDSNNSEAWYVVNSDVTIGGTLNFNDDAAHLILCDGATLTVNGGDDNSVSCINLTIYGQSGGTGAVTATGDGSGIIAGERLTINGGTITATGNEGITADGSITINGGCVSATGQENGIYANITINGGSVSATGQNNGIVGQSVTINGGNVSATGDPGICADAITLGWTNASDRIYASNYFTNQSVQVKSGQYLTDGTATYSGQKYTDEFNDAVADKTLMGVDVLYDAPNNNTYNNNRIANLNGKETNIYLTGRTLYKDGDWNTLCLPFSVVDGDGTDNVSFTGTPLEGATVMTLGNSQGCNTGFDAATGTLNLDFVPANEIEPGVAYIVKWNKADGYVDDDEHNLVNPVFAGVTIENEAPADHAVVSEDQKVSFIGTYSRVPFTAGDRSVLFMGSSSTLYYPGNDMTMNAFRSYFQLADGSTNIKEFRLNFGEDDATSIVSPLGETEEGANWYDLNGRKLDGKPSKGGIYIHNGRKVMVK